MKVFLILVLFALSPLANANPSKNLNFNADDCAQSLEKDNSEAVQTQTNQRVTEFYNITQTYCCKVCKKGQACGNSCISWDKTCHQPPGCACQG
jgi:hypothetical protein